MQTVREQLNFQASYSSAAFGRIHCQLPLILGASKLELRVFGGRWHGRFFYSYICVYVFVRVWILLW